MVAGSSLAEAFAHRETENSEKLRPVSDSDVFPSIRNTRGAMSSFYRATLCTSAVFMPVLYDISVVPSVSLPCAKLRIC